MRYNTMIFRYGILAAIATFLIVGNSLESQTRFDWPDKRVDVASYTRIDQCLGAANRVVDSVEGGTLGIKDSIKLKDLGPFTSHDSSVILVAQRCTASFSLERIPDSYTLLAQRALLLAHRYPEVIKLYQRKLDNLNSLTERGASLDTIVTLLSRARPAKIMLADSLVENFQYKLDSIPSTNRLSIYATLCTTSYRAFSAFLMNKYCSKFVEVVYSMEQSELNPGLITNAIIAQKFINFETLKDSLKISTDAYVSALVPLMRKVTRGLPVPGDTTLGTKAAPVIGDFWNPESARDTVYPRIGRVSLVISMPMVAAENLPQLASIAVLRRLVQSFPDLDIIGISGTTGYFGPLEPPSPERQAQLLHSKFVDFYKIPIVSAITDNPFWKLPDPDRRRANTPYQYPEAFTVAYASLLGWANLAGANIFNTFAGVLIDADGRIVDWVNFSTFTEEHVSDLIGILDVRAKR